MSMQAFTDPFNGSVVDCFDQIWEKSQTGTPTQLLTVADYEQLRSSTFHLDICKSSSLDQLGLPNWALCMSTMLRQNGGYAPLIIQPAVSDVVVNDDGK